MRDLFLLAFILAIPALAVMGHDVWMAYNNTHLDVSERFYLSDLGWLWVNYSPETYNWMVDNTDAVIWNGFIDPMLKESALYIASVPLAIYLVILLISKIFGFGNFEGNGLFKPRAKSVSSKKKKGDFAFGNSEKKRAKYKRK